jgi:ABC-type transport system substrate-binding protein
VPEGHTRITFNLIQNATWSDGQPITAEDVAFSLNFYRNAPGNPFGPNLKDMTAAYAKTTYQVVVEFGTVSYWHLHACGYQSIIPKHFFVSNGITISNWNTWNPKPPTDAMVVSGPFNITNYVAGEFAEMTYNSNYFYGIPHTAPTTTTPAGGPDVTMAIVAGAVGAAVVILVGGYVLMRQK